MQLSKSLLNDPNIGHLIFQNSLVQIKSLLSDIYGLNFNNSDPNIIELTENKELNKFNAVFIHNGRNVTAALDFEESQDDIVRGVIRIHDFDEEIISIPGQAVSFNDVVAKIESILEERFALSFIHLDPDQKDVNIKDMIKNDQDETLEIAFTIEDQEATFKAMYKFKPDVEPAFKLVRHNQHIIYLE
jgi:hypothetical protein